MTKIQQKRINKLLPLVKAIRKKCLDCCAGNPHEVKLCCIYDCPLYHYRNRLSKISKKSPCKKLETDEKDPIREWIENG